ncbi:MAG: hypothetical protein IPJ14_18975 [Kineosporiaceae bacterium]|nr:hypothetical protein [Kineosporiaceae bacterium]MBK7624676.1 hypothetical protein [Kineosporiaceae bacterium]MBK8076950.1 hypothetical protein [Kineosporiaceae bacterium]
MSPGSIDDWYADANLDGRMEPKHDWANDDAPDRSTTSWIDRKAGVPSEVDRAGDTGQGRRRKRRNKRSMTAGELKMAAHRIRAYEPHLTPAQVAFRLREAGFDGVTKAAVARALAKEAPSAREPHPSSGVRRAYPVAREDLARSVVPPKAVNPAPPPPSGRGHLSPSLSGGAEQDVKVAGRRSWWAKLTSRVLARRAPRQAKTIDPARPDLERAGSRGLVNEGRREPRLASCPSCGAPIGFNGSCRCS